MLRSIVIALCLCAPVVSARAADVKSVYNPEEFTISYWNGPPPHFSTPERYKEIKDANFTLAFPPCWGVTVADNRKMLDFCQHAGLKAIIHDSRIPYAIGGSTDAKAKIDAIVADYADHPALLGYSIVDEPGAGAFDGLAEVVAYLKEKDPKHPGFINLLPTYARDFPGALGTKTYEEHVRQYADKVKPFVISYDHYHFTNEGDRSDFFENLDTVRKIALEKKIPFWNIVLVTQHMGYRHLTEPELRFEAMQTLAFGARGLLWFTYWDPTGPPNPGNWSHAMINLDGSRDPHYDMVKAINADAKAIGDVLGQCQSTNVFHHGEGGTIKMLNSPIVPKKGRLTVGVFKHRDGKTLALIANRDYKQPIKTSAIVQPANAAVEVFDPVKKTWSPVQHDAQGGVPITLPAGGGMLLRW
ncbi:MAG: hypothetical protein QOF78_158 [Phycisphaerales bacterium]|jgi:hypothetical protein|nr:hypothetical protein [Phycisphaerales bacterium]